MLPFVYVDGFPVPMYGVMACFGIAFAVAIALVKHKAFSLRKRDVLRLCIYATIGAIVGMRLFSIIGQIVKHGSNPYFWTRDHLLHVLLGGGGVFYGGLLGGFGLTALRAKIGRIDLKNVFDIAAYVGLAFQSIGRLGCYCAGCCYGITLSDGRVFPVQLFEAGFCFVALLAFLIIKPERRWPGIPLFPVYLIIYSVGRFVLEFFRGDANRGVWILSTSQWIGIALFALAIVWLWKSGFIHRPRKDLPLSTQLDETE